MSGARFDGSAQSRSLGMRTHNSRRLTRFRFIPGMQLVGHARFVGSLLDVHRPADLTRSNRHLKQQSPLAGSAPLSMKKY